LSRDLNAQDTPGLGSRQELERRLGLISPKDTARGFLFSAVIKVVADHADAAAVKRCTAVVGESTFPTFFNYPITSLVKLLYTAGWEVSGALGGFENALRAFGDQAGTEFKATMVGKTLVALDGIDTKHLLLGFPHAQPTGLAHGSLELRWTGARSGVFVYRGILIPYPYFEGSLYNMFKLTPARNVEISGYETGPADFELAFSWD
jgi:uncharacterized protein (TIGR02265 family)